MNRTFLSAMLGVSAALIISPASANDTYIIDGGHTHVLFKVERFGLSNTIASFTEISGVLSLDEEHPENSSVKADINIASVRSDNEAREDAVRSPFWFNAEEFPVAHFESSTVTVTGEGEADVAGNLTLHGVTVPLTLKVTLHSFGTDPVSKRKAVGFSASTMVNRHDFGISIAEGRVGSDVSIKIETLAIAPGDQ